MQTTDPIHEAKAVIETHEELVRAGDLDGILANAAADVVLLAADTPLVEGRIALRDFYAALLQMGAWDFGHEYRGAEVKGDLVVLHGVARGTLTPPEGVGAEFANNFILIFARQPDGKLRFWRVAFAASDEGGGTA